MMSTNGDSPDDHRDRATAPELPASADVDELLQKYADLATRQHQAMVRLEERDRQRDAARVLYEAMVEKRLAAIETVLSDLRSAVMSRPSE